MLNAISSANLFKSYQSVGQLGKQSAMTNNKPAAEKNPVANFAGDTTVEISDAGLNALANAQNEAVDENTSGAVKSDEEQLSDKAKSFLENLRKKYGNYDFVVSNDMDTSKTVGGTKEFSVMFTSEELEKMADDEDYATKIMGQVDKSVDMLKNLSEKDLGEGVQFSQLSVSFDSDGNMKLFAQLEKISADQQERLEAAKEKRAEEQKAAEEKTKTEDTEEDDADKFTSIFFKSADVEASSEEELLAKIFNIKWDDIDEQEAFI